jgi:acyl carrier protein
MSENQIIYILQKIFNDIFVFSKVKVNRKLKASQVKEWDSLNQINILIAIEKEFKIKFNIKEIQSMNNVGDTIDIIKKKI